MTKNIKKIVAVIIVLIISCCVWKYLYGAAASLSEQEEPAGQNLDVFLGGEERKEAPEEAPVTIWLKRGNEIVGFDAGLIKLSVFLVNTFGDAIPKNSNGQWISNTPDSAIYFAVDRDTERQKVKMPYSLVNWRIKQSTIARYTRIILDKLKHGIMSFSGQLPLGNVSPDAISLHELHALLTQAHTLQKYKAAGQPLNLEWLPYDELIKMLKFAHSFWIHALVYDIIPVLITAIKFSIAAHPALNFDQISRSIDGLQGDLENLIVEQCGFFGLAKNIDLLGDHAKDLKWSPDNTRIATVLNLQPTMIKIFDVATGAPRMQVDIQEVVNGLVWSSDSTKIAASGSGNGGIVVFDAHSGGVLTKISVNELMLVVGWSQDGDRIAGLNFDRSLLQIFDAHTGSLRTEVRLGRDIYNPNLRLNADLTKYLIANRGIEIRRVDDGSLLRSIEDEHGRLGKIQWSLDGTKIMGMSNMGEVYIFDEENATLVQAIENNPWKAWVFLSPDGTKIVEITLGPDGDHLFDVRTKKSLGKLEWSGQLFWSSDSSKMAFRGASALSIVPILSREQILSAFYNRDLMQQALDHMARTGAQESEMS